MKLKLTFTVDAGTAMSQGLGEATSGIRLESNGAIVIPVEVGNGMFIRNPAPAGTWELVDDE